MSQVIKKRRIVLASVLKPVDETRMLEKIGGSLVETNLFDVSIIGYPSEARPTGIRVSPLPPFKRLSFKRLVAPWIVFRKINEIKPEIIIINTPELLFIAALQRIFFGRKIVYDVLENYYRTILYTSTYPPVLKTILAFAVRLQEILFAPSVSRFFFAERGYIDELKFAKSPIVLQNKMPKALAAAYRRTVTGNSKLIFSGTLAETSGVFEAINLCKNLHKADPSYKLTLIGYCSMESVLGKIKDEIKDSSFIKLIGGNCLVPHSQILEEISKADFGIIIYPNNPSTISSIPTKLFEYVALQLPILIRHNAESHKLVEEYHVGIILDASLNYESLSRKIKTHPIQPAVSDAINWDFEAGNLIACLKLL